MIVDTKTLQRKLLRNGYKYDNSLLLMIILLSGFSLIMVYSSSIAYALQNGNSFYYLLRQLFFLVFGAGLGFAAFHISLDRWKKLTPYILFFSFVLLLLVLVFGAQINGSKRWIHVGPINIQPTEVFKLAIILYLSSFFTRRAEVLKNFRKTMMAAVPVGLGLGLIIIEPDFGSCVVVSVITVSLLFLAGVPFRWFAMLIVIIAVLVVTLILFEPYRLMRVTTFLDPWATPEGSGYQLTHSLIGIGRGGWFGVGLGASVEKLFFLPEAHTDFILAVIGEEFGFVGIGVLVACYVWLVMRAIAIGRIASTLDRFYGSFVAYGIGVWIGIQSFFNIGVNIGLVPTKGLTLPLMSYGGSAVIIMLLSLGLLMRVDYENRQLMRGFQIKSE